MKNLEKKKAARGFDMLEEEQEVFVFQRWMEDAAEELEGMSLSELMYLSLYAVF
jgi:hypothetical protein